MIMLKLEKKTIELLFYNLFYSESEICKQLYNS